jgi:plastocyanin
MVKRPLAVLLLTLALAGLGSAANATETKEASCTPDGTALQLKAFDQKFDKNCLAAPATQDFTIEFSNLDRGIPHNVAIYEDETAKKNFFKGGLTDGPGKQTYSVKGLPAGTWFFRCDPHPEMHGTFVSA